jgi:hypothetical protein
MKLENLLVWTLVTELGMLFIGSTIGELKTIALSAFSLSRKVFLAEGAKLIKEHG